MFYEERIGDLFKISTDYRLVHCIAADFIMGAGIATSFVKRHPNLRNFLENQANIVVGDAVVYDEGNGHSVINLITKQSSYAKPTREDFNKAIRSLKLVCVKNSFTKIAMPLIGSGIDQLDWEESSLYIKEVFQDTNIEIIVIRLPE